MISPIETYLSKIEADFRGGKATEHTYRSALESLLEATGKGIEASNDPKHVACGAPDFIVERRKVPLGYVETKDLGVDLDKVEKSDQMKRYLKALSNLILTDYLEFRWYVNGVRKLKIRIAEVGKNNLLVPATKAADIIAQLLGDFFATEAPTVGTPKELAERLAGVTHFIRDQIIAALESGDPDLQKALAQQYKTFVELLLPTLTHAEFADLYAQAITYGLFAAKLTAPEGVPFAFEDAYKYLRGNPFLRRLFMDVNEQLDEIDIIRPYLNDLVALLNRADFHSILKDFGRRIRTEDPVVHFYETFLATYDPKLRESRGVYYTPEPVVQFIVNSVDELLKTRFGKAWGLADESVKVLDPATGTGTFLYYVIRKIHEEVVGKRNQSGQWKSKSKDMLKRIFGFELLIAPYVVSHLKLGLLMQTLEAPLEGHDERLHVYMTNTLEEGVTRAETLAGLGLNIAQESSDAAHVKKLTDIMVVLGNPPYSYESINNGQWITTLIRDYYEVDGMSLGEANPKGLQDDYVKFIRFGEWRINQTGYGILAFVTNHGYLDNPTFRGMRQHLMNTFDEIYVLDLHGNSKKKEVAPDGSKDENVFDIQQGVAILLAVKGESKDAGRHSVVVKHNSLWGLRESKYIILQSSHVQNIDWVELHPQKPFYLFKPQNIALLDEYYTGWKITDIMKIYSVGIVTSRDELAIYFTPGEAKTILARFISLSSEDARRELNLGEDSIDWKVSLAQNDLKKTKLQDSYLKRIHYRPFDIRYTYFTGQTRGFHSRPRQEVMRQMANENLALLTSRLTKGEDFAHVQVTEDITEKILMSAKTSNNSFHFPLYIYTTPENAAGTLFAQTGTTRRANLSDGFIQEFSQKLDLEFVDDPHPSDGQFGPEDVFYYAYAVFHSPTYRQRYTGFLKIDFPRLPLTSDKELFFKLGGLGKKLVELHLLKSPKVEEFITSYPVAGDDKVEKVVFTPSPQSSPEGRFGNVWINAKQYFGEVPEEVWSFKVGGYQVCEKWLKDRKGRILSSEDISHYQRVVVALKETIRIMEEIDKVIPGWPMV